MATGDTLGPVPPVHYFAPVKGVATLLLTYWSGVPGGIFAPTVSVGTGIGHWLLLRGRHSVPPSLPLP